MKMFTLRSQFHLLNLTNPTSLRPSLNPNIMSRNQKHLPDPPTITKPVTVQKQSTLSLHSTKSLKHQESISEEQIGRFSRRLVVGAVSVGFVMFVMGLSDDKALALGPEGPLMEEFWENVRRYALYALTVSTGALYIIFQPIVELLKNPISAILILVILGGGIYIVSQVVSAMVGVTNFSYDYSY